MIAKALKYSPFSSVLLMIVSIAKGDVIVVTYEAPGVVAAQKSAICAGTTVCALGVEDFNSWTGGSFTTDFGTGNLIQGAYSGGFHNYAADQYGGAGGTGTYPEIFVSDGSYSVTLTTSEELPGVNYFGLWYSALDGGNLLQFFKGDKLLYQFTPAAFASLVGACSPSNYFCGNPNTGYLAQDSSEQFAFLNVFDTTGYFDRIEFSEPSGAGGFESDNHTVAYLNPAIPTGTVISSVDTSAVPESATFSLLGCGLVLLAVAKLGPPRQH